MGGPTWLDITTQIVIPLASLLIAAAAIWYAHRSQQRQAKSEAAERRTNERAHFAERLREYSRRQRDKPFTSAIQAVDDWQDMVTAAPDAAAGRLIAWISEEYGALNQVFGVTSQNSPERTQALLNLQSDFESRIRVWQMQEEAQTHPHFGREQWPKPESPI